MLFSRPRVRARSSALSSARSRPALVERLEDRWLLAATLTATADSPTAVTLAWSGAGSAHLELEVKSPGDTNYHLLTSALPAGDAGSVTVGAEADTRYEYRLRLDDAGQGTGYAAARAG